MIHFITIRPNELHEHITNAYWEDYDLLKHFHIKEFGTCTEACTATLKMIAEADKEMPLTYYKVMYYNASIGYMVTFENCLYSFGINIFYRRASVLKEWMDQVRKLFKNDFSCHLYNRNKRAISFLLKNNFIISSENKEYDFVTLVNQYSCQS